MEVNQYELLDRKNVPDSDGFSTEYSWYVDTKTGEHVMVFGDSDIYKPEDGYFDAQFDTEDEASEWFNSYNGFEDESIEEGYTATVDANVVEESAQIQTRPVNRFMYKGYICDKCEDGYKIYTTTEWQFGRGLRLSEATVADEQAAREWIDNALLGGTGVASTLEDPDEVVEDTDSDEGSTLKESSTYNDLYSEIYGHLEVVAKKWKNYIGDKAQFAELVGRVADDVFESLIAEEATNASSVGQHKSSSIDIIATDNARLEKRLPINRRPKKEVQ